MPRGAQNQRTRIYEVQLTVVSLCKLVTPTDVFLLNARIVCLASSGARDRYNFVSVVATYTTDTSADPVTAQFEFSCGTPYHPAIMVCHDVTECWASSHHST